MNNIFNLYLFSLLLPIIFIIIIPLYVNISLYIDINIKQRPIKNKNLIISFVSLKLFFMLLVILHLIIFNPKIIAIYYKYILIFIYQIISYSLIFSYDNKSNTNTSISSRTSNILRTLSTLNLFILIFFDIIYVYLLIYLILFYVGINNNKILKFFEFFDSYII